MKLNNCKKLLRLQVGITILAVLVGYGIIKNILDWYTSLMPGTTRIPRSLLVISAHAIITFVIVILMVWYPKVFTLFNKIRSKLRWFRWFLIIALGIITSYFFSLTWSNPYSLFYLRLMFTSSILIAAAWLAVNDNEKLFDFHRSLAGIILVGSIFSITYVMSSVSSYPFSIGWSEGNRFWDYSVLWGKRLYDYPQDRSIFSYIDRGRQALWGLIFLLPKVTIRGMRLWDSILFTLPFILLGLFIFRPRKNNLGLWVILGLWSYSYLDQGPIYSPLILAAILVAGAKRMPTWLAFVFVALAGYYAQVTRSTWMFAPAMWAGLLAFIDATPPGVKTTLQRWIRAAVLAFGGLAGGVIIPEILRTISANRAGVERAASMLNPETVATSVDRQPLLWERLLPNPTYPEGILLALVMACVPLLVLLVYLCITNRWKLELFQKLAVIAVLTAFLGVGLVISVKIGGGSNLHNLDMFLIGLLFTAGSAWESGIWESLFTKEKNNLLVSILLFVIVLFPAIHKMIRVESFGFPPKDEIDEALDVIQTEVDKAEQDGEVLFIDQRQLLTFSFIDPIPLIPDYEKKYMMDQAMAANSAYFDTFYSDLENHRFSLIVSEPLWIRWQGNANEFGNENDAWVYWVSVPVLCYYEPIETFDRFGTQLLVPRAEPLEDPEVICPNQREGQ